MFSDLVNLGLGNLAGKNATVTYASRMYLQHGLSGQFFGHIKEAHQYLYHKIHGCIVIIEQQYAVHGRLFGFRLSGLNRQFPGQVWVWIVVVLIV